MSDSEIKAALTDWHALGLTLDAEGRGEPVEGRIAIGCVVRNRVAAPRRYGVTYRAVCLARAQFSCWWSAGGAENYARTIGLARALVEGKPLPIPPGELARLHESLFLAEGIIGGQLEDRSAGATHYMTRQLWMASPPEWAKGLSPVASVGRHVFFAGVDR